MHKIRFLLAVVSSFLLVSGVFGSASVYAAGSVVVTAETSANSYADGATFKVRFYATPSGANVYSVSFVAGLTNIVFRSFTPSTSSNGFPSSQVVMGGSSGSTSFEVAAGYSGPVAGSGSKTYIGEATMEATTAGSGRVAFSNVVAYDNDVDEMSGSGTTKNLTITAPSSGSGGSSSGGSGSGSGTTNPPKKTNVTTNPNNDSTASIPGDSDDGSAPSKVIPESDFAKTLQEGQNNTTSADQASDSDKKSDSLKSKLLLGAGVLAGLGLLALGLNRLVAFRRSRLEKAHHGFISTPPSEPKVPTQTNVPPPSSVFTPTQGPSSPPENNDPTKQP